jgi:hypothetical protein
MSRKWAGAGFLFLLLLLLAGVVFAAEQAQEKEKTGDVAAAGTNWAVLIGIEKYKNFPDLSYGVKDAKALADVLESDFGFPERNIITLFNKDATRQNIMATLGQFFEEPKKITDQDQVLVFFSMDDYERAYGGDRKLCYLVPYDGDVKNIQGTLISINELRDIAELIPAKHVLFIDNGCAGGMHVSMPPSYGFRDSAIEKPARQLIALQDHVKEAGASSSRSPFMDLLLKSLGGAADKDGNGLITGSELGTFMQSQAAAGADKAGTVVSAHLPVMADNFLGDFIFHLPPSKLAGTEKAAPAVAEKAAAGTSAGQPEGMKAAHESAEKPPEAKPSRGKPVESKAGEGPAIVIDATDVNVGEVSEGEKITCNFGIRNVGKQELKIKSARPG